MEVICLTKYTTLDFHKPMDLAIMSLLFNSEVSNITYNVFEVD